MQNLPRFLSDFRLTAHVWTKYFRNADRTVCLKIVLEKCDQHSRRSYYCVVQCVCEIFVSVTSFYTDAKTSCLCITKVRTASYFKVFLLSWRPSFYVTRSPEQHSSVRTGISRERNRSTVFFHNLSYHSLLSSGLHTTIISCFSN